MPRTKVYHARGGAELVAANGGTITIESGGTLVAENGSTITGLTGQTTFASSAEVNAGVVNNKVIAPDTLAGRSASASRTGLVELATDAEAITGTDTARAITPANLAAAATTHVAASSTTVAGKVELATDAEALAGSDTDRAVTPHALGSSIIKLDIISFTGKNGAGACTATGLKTSDIVLSVTGVAAGTKGDQAAKFESVVTVNDQIQQSDAGDLSSNVYMALVYRQS